MEHKILLGQEISSALHWNLLVQITDGGTVKSIVIMTLPTLLPGL